jgi:hypothetical protein
MQLLVTRQLLGKMLLAGNMMLLAGHKMLLAENKIGSCLTRCCLQETMHLQLLLLLLWGAFAIDSNDELLCAMLLA